MEKPLAAYLATKLGLESDVCITGLLRIPGGASRETWMFEAAWQQGGDAHSQEFVLRMDPPASLVESDRAVEYAFYEAFEGSDVPVPRMRWLENDPAHLGAPFFIMDKIPGCDSSPRRIQEPAYNESRAMLGRQMYETLGRIHRRDWRATGVTAVAEAPAPDACWQRELTYWEGMIDRNELSPQPVARAAIRWLRANPPPPAQCVTVVHGDYRVGNFLYTPAGIAGVVDWEMAHLGDPLEDLAWGFMEYWEWGALKQFEDGGVLIDEAGGSTIELLGGHHGEAAREADGLVAERRADLWQHLREEGCGDAAEDLRCARPHAPRPRERRRISSCVLMSE